MVSLKIKSPNLERARKMGTATYMCCMYCKGPTSQILAKRLVLNLQHPRGQALLRPRVHGTDRCLKKCATYNARLANNQRRINIRWWSFICGIISCIMSVLATVWKTGYLERKRERVVRQAVASWIPIVDCLQPLQYEVPVCQNPK